MIWSALKSPHFFPVVSMILGVCATARWAFERNLLQATFWGLGVVLTLVATLWFPNL